MPDPVGIISRNAALAGQPLAATAAVRMQNQQRGLGGADRPALTPLVHPGSGWFSWLQNPGVLLSAAQAFFSKPRAFTLEQISAAERRYIASEKIKELSLRSNSIGGIARKVIQAGEEAHDQASKLLKSFLLYKNAYRSDGSSTSDPIVLEVMTNRLFEDILIYLVLNYRKNMLRLKLQALIPQNIGQSQSFYPTLSGKVPLLPWELLDALTEIVKANPEKAKKYMLKAHEGAVRENARLPYIIGTEGENLDEQSYFEIMQPAIDLYEMILSRRIAAFGNSETPVNRATMASRLAQSTGSNIKKDAQEALANVARRNEQDRLSGSASVSASASLALPESSLVAEQLNVNATANANLNAALGKASNILENVGEAASKTSNTLGQGLQSLINAAAEAATSRKRSRNNNYNANNNSQGSPKNARVGPGPNSQTGGRTRRRNHSRRNKTKSRKNTYRKRR
uniref:Uncharacterized protein n=1 Tax=viral metagenome TaxID=1070528 RepID=A0A6C0KLT2_9ZZZZ